uniref:phospholipase A2 n=1 Tax=Clastoptera arizonana TaxID=38151 RepID=A0A1B6DBA0_9HEMI
MSWLTAGNVLRNIFNVTPNPNKVIEVKQDKYADRSIICREDSLVLFEPSSSETKYEILLYRPYCDQAFSLCRFDKREDSELRFICYKDKIPNLVTISTVICSLNGLQRVCDLIQENPSWNIAHLVVSLNLTDCLQHPLILSCLNTPDETNGLSPLQLAVKCSNLTVVKSFIANGAIIDHIDNEGNTAFHFGASTNKDIILALIQKTPPQCLNLRNIDGYTPLHLACLRDHPDCVQTLLSKGADVNISADGNSNLTPSSSDGPKLALGDFMADNQKKLYSQDMKFGGTPLHWSSSRQVIEQLLDCNCDINILNFKKQTALHVMVLRNRIECAVALMSRCADLDILDSDGNSALHVAVLGKNIPILQALIVFGADISLLNNEGRSARHIAAADSDSTSERMLYILHATGAPRCPESTHGCTQGCMAGGTWVGLAPPPIPSLPARQIFECFENEFLSSKVQNVKGGRVLCLDGGGIRGLILVTILLHLEAAVGKPIIHCFDWVAGTSTGAILALGLARGKSLKECLCLYFQMKEKAFLGSKPYSSEPLETILKSALGTETVMADIIHPKMMVMGLIADKKPAELHIFRNYPSPCEILDPYSIINQKHPSEQFLWQAARASGAAPSYFRCFGRFLDGGLIANNPTLDALTEIHEYNIALKYVKRTDEVQPPKVVVSVGTGCIPVKPIKVIDIFRPENLYDTAKLALGVSSIAALLVDQATLADGRVIDRCNALCSMIGVPFFRFSPQLSEDIAMDEKNDEKLVNMLWETKAYINNNDKAVKKLASLLNCE